MALVIRGFDWLRDIDPNHCGYVGPKGSLATDPLWITGSLLREGSPGLVVAATALLHSGTDDEPPGAPSTANLAEDSLASLLFDNFFDNFLWSLNPIEAFAVTDLLIKLFCDTRLLRLRNVTDPRHSFEELASGNGECRAESM
jgi:hypothetical protein